MRKLRAVNVNLNMWLYKNIYTLLIYSFFEQPIYLPVPIIEPWMENYGVTHLSMEGNGGAAHWWEHHGRPDPLIENNRGPPNDEKQWQYPLIDGKQ